jgi:OHCU decarboxylase
MNDLKWFNELTNSEATLELMKCCGSQRWAAAISIRRPFASLAQVKEAAADIWWSLDRDDWLEAFRSHPKIGERKAQTEGTAQAQQWSEHEQAGVAASKEGVREDLARLNREYEEKFGYIFIVCATGKSSDEMLAILGDRLRNQPGDELPIAAGEQAKITELRLAKLLANDLTL